MIKYHTSSSGRKFAEIEKGSAIISEAGDMLDIMVNAGYNDCNGIIIHSDGLHNDFFDLKTGLAGEILQKFSNYRMRLAIVGDFTSIKSKSLRDFIMESNRRGTISFVTTSEEALSGLDKA
jgi:hypothetical protein